MSCMLNVVLYMYFASFTCVHTCATCYMYMYMYMSACQVHVDVIAQLGRSHVRLSHAEHMANNQLHSHYTIHYMYVHVC